MHKKALSFHTKIAFISAFWVTAVSVLLFAGIYYFYSLSLLENLDKLLYEDIERIEDGLVFDNDGNLDVQLSFESHTEVRPDQERVNFLIRDDRGEIIHIVNPSIEGIPAVTLSQQSPSLSFNIFIQGREFRLQSRRHGKETHTGKGDLVVQVMRSLEKVTQDRQTLLQVMFFIIPFPVLLSALGSWVLSRYFIKPISQMIKTVNEISANDLNRRIPISAKDEIGQLAHTFNHLLNRLESSFNTLKQFTADVSHELRTPLTAIKTQSEVILRQPRSAAEYQEALVSVLEELDILERTLEQLLQLSRSDANLENIHKTPVDMLALINNRLELYGVLIEDKRLKVTVIPVGAVSIFADPLLLDRIVVNLIDNAVSYTPPGGEMQIHLSNDHLGVMFKICNTGVAFSPEQISMIFRRFTKIAHRDKPTQTPSHGLGLALVKWAVELHGGSVAVENAHDKVCFSVKFPGNP